jgi:DNA-binding PadR family transcriptional regulator
MVVKEHLPLSAREFHILLAVSERPLNGYQIAQSVEETSRGTVRLSPATQDVNLHRLVEKGLVCEVTKGERSDGRGQRFWKPTALGTRVLRAEAERLTADAALALAAVGRKR